MSKKELRKLEHAKDLAVLAVMEAQHQLRECEIALSMAQSNFRSVQMRQHPAIIDYLRAKTKGESDA